MAAILRVKGLQNDKQFQNIPPVAIRWALVRDPAGSFASQAMLCTDHQVDLVQILEWFVMRWPVEVTVHEVRTHLGVEKAAR